MSDDSASPSPGSPRPRQLRQNQLEQQQQQFSARPPGPSVPVPASSAPGSPAGIDFFAGYQPPPGVYDEILGPDQQLRPHWKQLSGGLGKFGPDAMQHRSKQIRRMVRQNGTAFSAYGDPSVRQRHLQLDPLPQLIPGGEWEQIEAALRQRAELLNRLLADLYGPRTLLSGGVLPPGLLFDHPHYNLPFHDLPAPGGKHLHGYAAELVRSPKGNWWVRADRTDSPGGSGFALENRILISRAFPNQFRRNNVRRLAPYFMALRDHLASLATGNQENPHVVILTAGAGNAAYFEDSYLARYLGFSLVQSDDLVVRSGRVMLKTLAGLVPIDVIFRRQHGNSLDPLELGGGAPGIPGILQVIRDGNVAVVNAAGSGLVESPIFMAFMPRICQALMKEELRLPGVATWWGGEPNSLTLMLDRMDDIDLMPAFRRRSGVGPRPGEAPQRFQPQAVQPETMSRDERRELLRQNPTLWVGQEKVARSSMAVWDNGSLKPGHVSMRVFLTASGDDWCALPGGLIRITELPDGPIRHPLQEGGTKDAWVLADKPVEPSSLLKSSGEILKPSRSRGFLPSRIADNLCWLGRYLERADSSARQLRAVVSRLTSETDPDDAVELPPLVRALSRSGQVDVGYAIEQFSRHLPKLETSLPRQALDHGEPNSLRSQVDQVVSLAGTVRDRLSVDAWRIIQEMSSHFEHSDPGHCDLLDLLDLADTLIVNLAAFSGFVSEFMTRTHAFRFLNIGRRLEHAQQMTSLVKHLLAAQTREVPGELLEAVLEISDSTLTYRSRYYANLQLPAVLDLLLVDDLNPRSLAYQLIKLRANLESLPGTADDLAMANIRQLASDAIKTVQSVDVVALSRVDRQGRRSDLQAWLAAIGQQLPAISTAISNRFLVHSGPLHQLIADDYR